MKKQTNWVTAVLALIVLAVILFTVGTAASYELALGSADISKSGCEIVDSGINANGDEYRVVAEYLSGDNRKIVYLTKNVLGFWRIDRTEDATMAWTNVAGIRSFGVSDSTVFEHENHLLYCGNNATKRIELPEGALPHNVTVGIYPAGSTYMLHFVAYGDATSLNNIQCEALLKDAGCIQ